MKIKLIRQWRHLIDRGLTLAGVVVVLLPVLYFADTSLQVAVVVVGILMIEAGVWGLARQLGRDPRTFLRLRSELDAFIERVRDLNSRAVEGDEEGVEAVRRELHARVDEIVRAAGVERDAEDASPAEPGAAESGI